jgi:hypothetical protein
MFEQAVRLYYILQLGNRFADQHRKLSCHGPLLRISKPTQQLVVLLQQADVLELQLLGLCLLGLGLLCHVMSLDCVFVGYSFYYICGHDASHMNRDTLLAQRRTDARDWLGPEKTSALATWSFAKRRRQLLLMVVVSLPKTSAISDVVM